MPAPILALVDLRLPPRGALIGLDLGTKTIGVATSDPDRRLAIGVETVARTNFSADARRLLVLAAERKAVGFVLGLPINAIDPRVRAQPRTAHRAADRILGRAALHRSGRARADCRRCTPRQAQGGDRRARRDLHPAGRARSARSAAPGAMKTPQVNASSCGSVGWAKAPGTADGVVHAPRAPLPTPSHLQLRGRTAWAKAEANRASAATPRPPLPTLRAQLVRLRQRREPQAQRVGDDADG
jgi:hypothetical protein